jgi:hypothetical protein
MADLRTTVTEVVTALGTLGGDDLDRSLRAGRPTVLRNVDDDVWMTLQEAWAAPGNRALFHAAWENGRAFLNARDALRGRRPEIVEWKGAHRAPGDEVVPADIRIDHVYFVSCKYLSQIVVNASPAHVFDRLLAGGHGKRSADWFGEVAPREHAALYEAVRGDISRALPATVDALTASDRRSLAADLRSGWSDRAAVLYEVLVDAVAQASATRWKRTIGADSQRLLWRLLRIASAPYYVLGVASGAILRLRIATPWDWRERFELCDFQVSAGSDGQAVVRWQAVVRDKHCATESLVNGHVEVRWSHGRFCGPPEAKVYLDTPHRDVPGYFALV